MLHFAFKVSVLFINNNSSYKHLLRFVQFSYSPHFFTSKRSRPKYSESKLGWYVYFAFKMSQKYCAHQLLIFICILISSQLSIWIGLLLYIALMKEGLLSKTEWEIRLNFCNLVQRILTRYLIVKVYITLWVWVPKHERIYTVIAFPVFILILGFQSQYRMKCYIW